MSACCRRSPRILRSGSRGERRRTGTDPRGRLRARTAWTLQPLARAATRERTMNGFEEQPLKEPEFFGRLIGRPVPENAFVERQNLLATTPIGEMAPLPASWVGSTLVLARWVRSALCSRRKPGDTPFSATEIPRLGLLREGTPAIVLLQVSTIPSASQDHLARRGRRIFDGFPLRSWGRSRSRLRAGRYPANRGKRGALTAKPIRPDENRRAVIDESCRVVSVAKCPSHKSDD